MTLVEEYFTRHGITTVPVVNYPASFHLYLSHGGSSFRRINAWTDDSDVGPPVYIFDETIPAHNPFDKVYFKVTRRRRLEWDEYEPFILDWVRNLPPTTRAVTGSDIHCAAVSSFATCFNLWLLREASSEVKKAVCEAILGHGGGRDFDEFLSLQHDLNTTFRLHFYNPSGYAHWLARLVNDRSEPYFQEALASMPSRSV